MRILAWRTVVLGDRLAFRTAGAVGSPKGFILGHTVVCAIELHVGDAVVTLDTSSLLKSLGNLIVNFSEDGDLSLDDLLLLPRCPPPQNRCQLPTTACQRSQNRLQIRQLPARR